MATAKPATKPAIKKLVIDEKLYKKIDTIVTKYNDGVKAQKKAVKEGVTVPADPETILNELGSLIGKAWKKIKTDSGIKDEIVKPVAKKPEAKKPVAKKPAAPAKAAVKAPAKAPAKKAPAKKPAGKTVAKKPSSKSLMSNKK